MRKIGKWIITRSISALVELHVEHFIIIRSYRFANIYTVVCGFSRVRNKMGEVTRENSKTNQQSSVFLHYQQSLSNSMILRPQSTNSGILLPSFRRWKVLLSLLFPTIEYLSQSLSKLKCFWTITFESISKIENQIFEFWIVWFWLEKFESWKDWKFR